MDFPKESVPAAEGLLIPLHLESMKTPTQDFYHLIQDQNCTLDDFPTLLNTVHSTRLKQVEGLKGCSNQKLDDSYPQAMDMQFWIVSAILLIFARRLAERHIFIPLGRRWGIKERPKNQNKSCRIPSAVHSLEKAYSLSPKKMSDEIIDKLCNETGLQAREIERWFRRRRALDKTSILIKFSESGWRFVCYVMSTIIGTWAMWGTHWFWDVNLFWENHPNQTVSREVWIYYVYGSGLYLSFLITQAFDVKRKDFWEMFVHHIITISLLSVTWTFNFTRLGAYVLLLHDCSDVFLEAAKMAIYTKKQDLSTGIFVIFTLVWIFTRLIIYPKKILIESCPRMPNYAPPHISYPIISGGYGLFGLHLFWTYFIFKVAISAIKSGTEKQKDTRSSTESDFSEESETPPDSDSEERAKFLRRRESIMTLRRLSLQVEHGTSLLDRIDKKQVARTIMKRISVEIM